MKLETEIDRKNFQYSVILAGRMLQLQSKVCTRLWFHDEQSLQLMHDIIINRNEIDLKTQH